MKSRKIKNRIFIPLALSVSILMVFTVLSFGYFIRNFSVESAEHCISQAKVLTNKVLELHVDNVTGMLDIIKNDPALQKSWLDEQRKAGLYEAVLPIYQQLNAKNGIDLVAFYPVDSVGVYYVRDSIVFEERTPHEIVAASRSTNAVTSGVFVDAADSTFSMRVVYPWYINGKLSGYIEMGKPLRYITQSVVQVFDIELSIDLLASENLESVHHDSMLQEQVWESYMIYNGRNKFSFMDKELFLEYFSVQQSDDASEMRVFDVKDKKLILSRLPLGNNKEQALGITFIKKMTLTSDAVSSIGFKILTVAVVVCALIFSLFWFYIKSVERSLHKSHEELEIARQRSDVANHAKTNFLTNMSHEIRTPLNAIIGFSQILLKRTRNRVLNDDDLQFIENINASGKNLNLLINDVLDLSKIEAGKAIVVERDFMIKEFVANIISTYKPQAFKNRIEFVSYFDPDIPVSIKSDKGKMNQILINLIGNAIKYTPDGSRIEFSALKEGDSTIAFKVVNEGVEIPLEKQKIIFDPFERINRDVHKTVKGTGLGLAITKNLVELLGGSIFLTSQNQRTEFTVVIPYKDTVVIEFDAEMSEVEKVFVEDATILIVEDNEMNISILKTFFEDYNYKILWARDGEAALESIYTNNPDLVLMDIQIPKMSGIEVVENVRRSDTHKGLPIIAMSANAFMEHKNEAEAAGMNDYITKPIDFDELIVVLEKYLYEQGVGAAIG